MPLGMYDYVQSVLVHGTMYVGGGTVKGDNGNIVMAYKISTGKWSMLPLYSTHHFAMAAVDNQLILVGGVGGDGHKSTRISTWRPDRLAWTPHLKMMSTKRSQCSAVVYSQWLIVAGGRGDRASAVLTSVEVLNTETKEWYAATPTPIAWYGMKTAVVGDMCYFMGGNIEGRSTKRVYTVSLPALIFQAISSRKDSHIWKELPEVPFVSSAPVSINESLVAVGGMGKGRATTKELHLYKPDQKQWVKTADMPSSRYDCTCTMITDKELHVVGGWDSREMKNVDIAQIL